MTVQDRPTARTRRHRLPAAEYAGLARGHGSAAAVREIARTERSHRLVTLQGVVRAVADSDPGPLARAEKAWQLLAEADRADPRAAEATIMYPHAGIWIAHLYRRIRGTVIDDSPLWLDGGYLHALAATAAIRAGLSFTIDIPVRDGAAVLPGHGYARFPGLDARAARVESVAGTVVVSADGRRVRATADDPAWHPMPVCDAESGGARLTFALDHFDPYRNMRDYSAPDPLSADERRRWQEVTEQAWKLLVDHDRGWAESVAASLVSLVPLPATEPYRPRSASCDSAFAAVIASAPDDAEQFAATLIHETQHVRLGALLHLDELTREETGPRLWAPWRDDPRPLPGLIQGIYAFVGITDFWRLRGRPVTDFEFALWRRQLTRVLAGLDGHPGLTPLGQRLLTDLAGTVAGWADHQAGTEVGTLAEAAAIDHYALWRAYHLPVPGDLAERLAGAWLSGERCPALPDGDDPEPVLDTSVAKLDTRAVLMRMRLGEQRRPLAGALPGDASFVAGDHAEARDAYVRHLSEHPGDPHGWVGLALALTALGDAPALLLDRPELVRAVARRVAARGEPVRAIDLAHWFEYC